MMVQPTWSELQEKVATAIAKKQPWLLPNLRRAIIALKRQEPTPAIRQEMYDLVGTVEQAIPRLNLELATEIVAQAEKDLAWINSVLQDPRRVGRIIDISVLEHEIMKKADHARQIEAQLRPRFFNEAREVLAERISNVTQRAQEILDRGGFAQLIKNRLRTIKKHAQQEKVRQEQARQEKRLREIKKKATLATPYVQKFKDAMTAKDIEGAATALRCLETYDQSVQALCLGTKDSAMELRHMNDQLRSLRHKLFGKKGVRNLDAKPARNPCAS